MSSSSASSSTSKKKKKSVEHNEPAGQPKKSRKTAADDDADDDDDPLFDVAAQRSSLSSALRHIFDGSGRPLLHSHIDMIDPTHVLKNVKKVFHKEFLCHPPPPLLQLVDGTLEFDEAQSLILAWLNENAAQELIDLSIFLTAVHTLDDFEREEMLKENDGIDSSLPFVPHRLSSALEVPQTPWDAMRVMPTTRFFSDEMRRTVRSQVPASVLRQRIHVLLFHSHLVDLCVFWHLSTPVSRSQWLQTYRPQVLEALNYFLTCGRAWKMLQDDYTSHSRKHKQKRDLPAYKRSFVSACELFNIVRPPRGMFSTLVRLCYCTLLLFDFYVNAFVAAVNHEFHSKSKPKTEFEPRIVPISMTQNATELFFSEARNNSGKSVTFTATNVAATRKNTFLGRKHQLNRFKFERAGGRTRRRAGVRNILHAIRAHRSSHRFHKENDFLDISS